MVAIASKAVNNAKNRLQALGLLDRSFKATPDAELTAAVEALPEEHRAALDELVGGEATPDRIRAAVTSGRMDGTMESIALVLTDACLAECIEELGDNAENPTADQLTEVLPGLIKKYGKGIVQIMLSETVVGDAPAANMIRDVLKNDDSIKLPPAEFKSTGPVLHGSKLSDDERAAVKAKRKELKAKKQEAARAAREQSQRDRRRV